MSNQPLFSLIIQDTGVPWPARGPAGASNGVGMVSNNVTDESESQYAKIERIALYTRTIRNAMSSDSLLLSS
jgi:hypothetical protein